MAAFGIVPPDLSVMAKARAIASPFPQWVFNYFTTYSEGGPDYIYALMTGYEETPPEGASRARGQVLQPRLPGPLDRHAAAARRWQRPLHQRGRVGRARPRC